MSGYSLPLASFPSLATTTSGYEMSDVVSGTPLAKLAIPSLKNWVRVNTEYEPIMPHLCIGRVFNDPSSAWGCDLSRLQQRVENATQRDANPQVAREQNRNAHLAVAPEKTT